MPMNELNTKNIMDNLEHVVKSLRGQYSPPKLLQVGANLNRWPKSRIELNIYKILDNQKFLQVPTLLKMMKFWNHRDILKK